MAEFTLTPEQQAVVDHRGGALLVSAAAGSGKTRVLVERLMTMVCDPGHPENIDRFLLITYTKAAAAELRAKIAAELSERLANQPGSRHLQRQLVRIHSAQISTVHSFCSELLRENAHLIDQPSDFRVLEQNEADRIREQIVEQVLDEAYAGLSDDPGRQELFDTLGAGRDDRALPGLILTLYEQVCCHRDPDDWMRRSEALLQLDPAQDAGMTPWGRLLMDELFRALDRAISQMEAACGEMQDAPKLEKAYLPVFQANLETFRTLRQCASWDELAAFGAPEKGRLGVARGEDVAEQRERMKGIRDQSWKAVEKAFKPFTDPSAVVVADLIRSGQAIAALFALVRLFRERYAAEKARLRSMDFSDLEQNSLRLLCRKDGSSTELARTVSSRYAEIMVDEYQDSNEVQEAIFRAVSQNERNLFFVGDVKQSIYRFRLADPTIFLEKYQNYPMAEPGTDQSASKLVLTRNFRSRPEILSAVNEVFRGVMCERVGELVYGDDEALAPGRITEPLDEPSVELHCIETVASEDENAPVKAEAEAAFVASRIAQLIAEQRTIEDQNVRRPIRPEDVVILMRSPRSTANVYLSALWRAGLPGSFEQTGDLMETMEIQLLLSFLQVIDNPRQDIPLAAVLMSPICCFSADELAMLRAQHSKMSLYDALCASEEEKPRQFLEMLHALRELRSLLPLEELLREALSASHLEELICALPEAAVRRENLNAFCRFGEEAGRRGQSLGRFLEELNQLREQGRGLPSAGSTGRGVRIMSIHSSKGLQFPVVVLADLSRRFNLEDLRAQVLTHPKWGAAAVTVNQRQRVRYPTIAKLALARVKELELRSEELRILYVAMTRAQELLIMTYCAANLKKTLSDTCLTAAYPVPEDLAADASCLGDWILQTAVTRMDAGALQAMGSRPGALRIPETRWRIEYHEQSAAALTDAAEARSEEPMQEWPDQQTLERLLRFRYRYAEATAVPAKLTATQLKGRPVDEELTDGPELLPGAPGMKFPLPDFAQIGVLNAAEKGTAMHLFMQYANYAACTDEASLSAEIGRLTEQEFLRPEQAKALEEEKLLRFFRSALGRRVLSCPQPVREFKFSILTDAGAYYPGAAGDELLLQGVVDCCLDEPEGLTILDFKTDRVRPGEEQERAEYYRGQLEAYSAALERIFRKQVREKCVYFFATDTCICL